MIPEHWHHILLNLNWSLIFAFIERSHGIHTSLLI